MFGIAKPCRHTLTPVLRREWMAHLCGLCLRLRDANGHAARLTTNVDAVVLSILVESQRPEPLARRDAGPCVLRGLRSASVVAADEPATVHAASVSLTMAATKLDDHAADGDGLPGHLPRLSRGVARRWRRDGEAAGREVAFDTGRLRSAVADSDARERRGGGSFDHYVAPTEEAAAAACRHTAFLAAMPGNVGALDELGRMFGRITYLVDAIDDEADDVAAGRFNALVAVEPDTAARRALARDLFAEAHARLTAAFDRLELARPELARAVLVDQLARVGRRALHHAGDGHEHTPSCRARARHELDSAARTTGALARVAVVARLAFPGFRPGVGPGAEGELPPTVPGVTPDEAAQQAKKQAPAEDEGCLSGCVCCCCDGADCCDCCDCCDGADCCDC